MSLRVYELAKQLGVPAKDLLTKVQAMGIEASDNFADLSTGQIENVKAHYTEPARPKEQSATSSLAGARKIRRRISSNKKDSFDESEIEVTHAESDVEEKTPVSGRNEDGEGTVVPTSDETSQNSQVEAEKAQSMDSTKEPVIDSEKKRDTKSHTENVGNSTQKESLKEPSEVSKTLSTPLQKSQAGEAKKSGGSSSREGGSSQSGVSSQNRTSPQNEASSRNGASSTKEKHMETSPQKREKQTSHPQEKDGNSQSKEGRVQGKGNPKKDVQSGNHKPSSNPSRQKNVHQKGGPSQPSSQKPDRNAQGKKDERKSYDDQRNSKVKKDKEGYKKKEGSQENANANSKDAAKKKGNFQKPATTEAGKGEFKDSKKKDFSANNKKGATVVAPTPGKKKFRGNGFEEDSENSSYSVKRKNKGNKRQKHGSRSAPTPAPAKVKHTFNPRKKDIRIGEVITVGELASAIGIKATEIIKSLMALDIMVTITQPIDGETASLVAAEFGVNIVIKKDTLEDDLQESAEQESGLLLRPPVVTVMGHVDHGKTSLLDALRKTNVIAGEAGGITQHIGAYYVNYDDQPLAFLDTPGHEAFTAMRSRGANVTDIVILVVAADDGPKPQTIEAIDHAKAADVPILVAINKCDKPDANPERTQQMLMEHGLISEEYGGDITMVNVSAKQRQGIDKLLEMVLLQAEIMELQANPNKPAQGVVLESRVDKGKGNIASVLVESGTLRAGDYLVLGSEFGKVRQMQDEYGKKVEEAGPSRPVEITGLNGVPKAGDRFNVGSDERTVRQIALVREQKGKEEELVKKQKINLEDIFQSAAIQDEKKVLNLIVKTDVIGSMEALSDALSKQGNEEVVVKVLHGAVGAITISDVLLAATSNAVIVGFNVRPEALAKKNAQIEGVDIRLYSVIYDAINDVRLALEGLLEPIIREEIKGKADVREVFSIPKIGLIAGTRVSDGKIVRNSYLRVLRDNIIIHDGKMASLKRFKDDVKEVAYGFECGIGLENYKDVRVGDILESYLKVEEAAKLE